MTGWTPPPVRPSRSNRWALWIVLGVVGLCCLLVVGGVLAALLWARHAQERDDREARGYPIYPAAHSLPGRPAWTLPVDQRGASRFAWRTGDLLVVADREQGLVTALSARDGTKRWVYRVPARPGDHRLCTRSEAVGGLVALTYPRGTRQSDCSGIVLLDLATGKPRWNIVRPNRIEGTGLAIAGGRLIVGDLDLAGLDLRTGAVRWSHRERDLGCGITDLMATVRTVAATAMCGPNRRREAWTLDPATGRALTRVQLEPTPAKPTMALAVLKSAEPLVVALSVVNVRSMNSTAQLVTLAPGNRSVQSRIDLPRTAGAVVSDDSAALAISGHRLVLPGRDGRLTGYDLSTGQLVWVKDLIAPDGAASRRTLSEVLLAGADQRGVYGVAVSRTEPGVGVFRVDPATGAITMISPVLDPSLVSSSGDSWLFWADGLYGVNSEPKHPVAFALR